MEQYADQALHYLKETAPVVFLTCTDDGKIIDANRFAQLLTGQKLINSYLKKHIVDFAGTFDFGELVRQSNHEHLLNIQTASGLPQSLYFRFKAFNDTVLTFGRLDIEELEIMRTKLLSFNHEFSNLTRQLQKKNAQLKKLNAEKNQFLGIAAHDLRNPIGLMLTYSEFLVAEAAPLLQGEHLRFLNTINAACQYMQQIVDDYLDYSAIEAGKFELNLNPASFQSVLEESLQPLQLKAAQKNIQLDVNCADSLPTIVMDAPKIEQVIINLVANALEHTPPDLQVAITVSLAQSSLIFAVKDQGPGIDPKERDKLFKPFATARAPKTSGEKSTGLGLLISRKIVEAHKGKITVESEPDKGSTVSFSLQIKESE